nr:hypothetical protein [Tanacetum cinerariifolium]
AAVGHQPQAALPLAAGAARGGGGQRGNSPRPGGTRPARPAQAGRAGAGHFKKSLGHLRPADPVSTYQHIAQRATQ